MGEFVPYPPHLGYDRYCIHGSGHGPSPSMRVTSSPPKHGALGAPRSMRGPLITYGQHKVTRTHCTYRIDSSLAPLGGDHRIKFLRLGGGHLHKLCPMCDPVTSPKNARMRLLQNENGRARVLLQRDVVSSKPPL